MFGTKQKALRPVCSLGMFDFFKGFAILVVIFTHTFDLFLNEYNLYDFLYTYPILTRSYEIMKDVVLWGFYIAAGYGIRKRGYKKCALQLKKMFLAPYICTGIAASFLLALNHFLLFDHALNALKEGLYLLFGFVLGQYPTAYYFGIKAYGIIPIWFVVSLTGGWLVLNFFLTVLKGLWRHIVIFTLGLIGFIGLSHVITYDFNMPLCLFRLLPAVFSLYIGYMVRENKWFEKKISISAVAVLLVCVALLYVDCFTITIPEVLKTFLNYFRYYPSIVLTLACLYLMVHVNRRENIIVNCVEKIGHNTLHILCLHTIEYYCMLWYWLVHQLSDHNKYQLFFTVYFLRCVYIAIGLLMIYNFKQWGGFARLKERFFPKKAT